MRLYYTRFKFASKIDLAETKIIQKTTTKASELTAANFEEEAAKFDELKKAKKELDDRAMELTLAISFIFDKLTNLILISAGLCYLIGILLVGLYYYYFIVYYR